MPELPDVEVYKRYFDSVALHQPISRIDIAARRIIAGASSRELERALVRQAFESTERHGKYLFARIGNGRWLMLHFGMTGSLSYYEDDNDRPRFTQLLVDFENGHRLAYVDPRKLGWVVLVDAPQDFIDANRLGPDALTLTFDRLRELMSGRRGAIKPWLMDQRVIAGIGNIYADEVLFQAGIHPLRNIGTLNERAIKRLFTSLRTVLKKAIAANADPERMPKSFLLRRRQNGAPVPPVWWTREIDQDRRANRLLLSEVPTGRAIAVTAQAIGHRLRVYWGRIPFRRRSTSADPCRLSRSFPRGPS